MLSYGNILHAFCVYRLRLKYFHKKRLWVRKIHHFLNLNYEVIRAVQMNNELDMVQEFYREYNYRQFQADIRKKMKELITSFMDEKDLGGDDFNAFILQQKKEKNSGHGYKLAA